MAKKILGGIVEVIKMAAVMAYGGLISAMGIVTLGAGIVTILGGVSGDSKKDETKPEG